MVDEIRDPLEKKPDESLTEYINRLETFGAATGDQRVRVHPDYVDKKGRLLVKPVISYLVDDIGVTWPQVAREGFPPEFVQLASVNATVAAQATIRPTGATIRYITGIWLVQGATAAGRDWTPQITNGTNSFNMCPTQNVASGATVQLWPYKAADNAQACLPPFPVDTNSYIELLDTMAVAETAVVWFTYIQRSSTQQS
jgi:hypothetical protein